VAQDRTKYVTQHLDLGTAVLDPNEPIVAGSYIAIRFTYTAGHPIDDSGYLKIAFRSVGDFGSPQFSDPSAPNYCKVITSGDCQVRPRWDPKGNTRPWGKALYLGVTGGFLDTGETITVLFGDTSGGSPGWQAQTFCEDTFELKTLVDPIATYEFKELPQSPAIPIIPGEAARAVCIAPSLTIVDQPFTYALKLEDRWGNPTALPIRVQHSGFKEVGVHRLNVNDGSTGLPAVSNPINVLARDVALHPYWADLHGQSEETVGTNTIDDYYAFARDYALLDISAHQGNDFQVTDALWEAINHRSATYHEPGRFVTFPGYEWSANTPLGGDRNVYLSHEGGRIVHSCADLLPGKRTAYDIAYTARELFKMLVEGKAPRAFAFAHVGGRYADLAMHDDEIELAVEVHSAWGTFEWLVEDALRRGYRIGICANSDGHKCRSGASYPGAGEFGSYGGLTCVLAARLDRESVLEALLARHFYATTGNRCLLEIEMAADPSALDEGRGDGRWAMMGDVFPLGGEVPRLAVRAVGTAPIESVEVRNGLGLVRTLRPYDEDDLGHRVKVVWSGAEVRGRARMSAWDGSLSVKGNVLQDVVPVNFWRPDRHPNREGDRVLWRSTTTGGVSGLILTLAESHAGDLEVETVQGRIECSIESIGADPQTWDLGGLRKRVDVYRLPKRGSSEFSFDLPLTALRRGDNPVYVRVTQEDGHMAWSSPVYVVVS
jgi:hypothetical protein